MIARTTETDPWPSLTAGSESCWWVLRTRSRQEKAVEEVCESLGVFHFLPLIETERYHGGRKRRVELPLFPGYVFLHGERETTFQIDRTRRIASILPVDDQQQLHEELLNLHRAIECDASFDPYPYLHHGDWVEVTAGPYRGLKGRVDRQTAPDKLILQIDVLQSAMAVEIDGGLLSLL